MSAGWTANVNWIVAIIQRPAIRERTSRSAMSLDSPVKRPARSAPRPIVLPSMIPETDSDSATSADMFGQLALLLGRDPAADLADPPGHPHRRRHEHQRDDRQPPVEQAHGDE